MSTDLRDALADLATEAPALDIADRAIALGRSRRRRHVLGAVATVAGLAVVAVVVSPFATRPDTMFSVLKRKCGCSCDRSISSRALASAASSSAA